MLLQLIKMFSLCCSVEMHKGNKIDLVNITFRLVKQNPVINITERGREFVEMCQNNCLRCLYA